MSARETSLNNATLVFKYGFGLFFCWFGLFLFNRQHPYGRRWLRWDALPYSEIQECGESWVYGYIRPRRFAFPWGSIYFVRPNASDSLFGLEKEMISAIRTKANI